MAAAVDVAALCRAYGGAVAAAAVAVPTTMLLAAMAVVLADDARCTDVDDDDVGDAAAIVSACDRQSSLGRSKWSMRVIAVAIRRSYCCCTVVVVDDEADDVGVSSVQMPKSMDSYVPLLLLLLCWPQLCSLAVVADAVLADAADNERRLIQPYRPNVLQQQQQQRP